MVDPKTITEAEAFRIIVRALKEDGTVAEVGIILEQPPRRTRRWPRWLNRLRPKWL